MLVLYLKDTALSGGGSLLQGLIDQWPQFFDFVTSFMTVLILWIGHYETFTYVVRTDRRFMYLNKLVFDFGDYFQ